MQLLAIQAADEARHIEVFTRRARLRRSELGLSTAGGQASLQTLLDEPDFALASFLLSVLGEGSFLALLAFLRDRAPASSSRARWTRAGGDGSGASASGRPRRKSYPRCIRGISCRTCEASALQ
jgi:hypothetical protein